MSSPDNKPGYREFESDNNPEMRLEFTETETAPHPGDHAIHEALVHIGVGYIFGTYPQPSYQMQHHRPSIVEAWKRLEESARNLGLLETPTIARIFELKQQTGGLGPLVSELSKATLDYNEALYNTTGGVTRREVFESTAERRVRATSEAQGAVVPTITCRDSRGFKSADQLLSNRMVNHGGREWIMDTSPELSSESRTFAFKTQEDRDAFVVDLEKRFPGIHYSVNLDPAQWAPEDADSEEKALPGAWVAIVNVTGLAV
jgi:hypothetical protein